MDTNIFGKANQIIRDCNKAYFGVIDENGCPHISAVSPINPENIFEVYFATGIDGNKAKRLIKDKRASVCFGVDCHNITLVGEAEIRTDQEIKNRLWLLDWMPHVFPGRETDPNYCIIKFTTKRVSLWIDNENAEFSIDELLTVQSRCGLLCKWCTYRESNGCSGCVETNGNPFHGECSVAKCCQDRGYHHCGECNDIPCKKLRQFSCDDAEHGDNPPGARIEVCKAWALRK